MPIKIAQQTHKSMIILAHYALSSCGSWYDVPTPLPSPPRCPPPEQDNESSSEDEEGFKNVVMEDYHEYDRWYAEDNQVELDEMHEHIHVENYYFKRIFFLVAETLTDEEVDSIIMMAI